MNNAMGRSKQPAYTGARPSSAGLPEGAIVLSWLLFVPAFAAAVETNCRIQTPARSIPPAMQPGHRLVRSADLLCGGRGDEICSELRGAFVEKRLPRLSPDSIRSSCRGEAREAWMGTWANVVALQQGHDASESKRAEAEAVFDETLKQLFRSI